MARPGWIDTLLAGLAPGVLLGTHVAGLIFFLNPHLPFSPGPVARGVLVYGGIVGLASLVLHLPFTARQSLGGRRARRWLPWALTIALATAAWLDASHASFYAFYLPAGINDRLVRTAAWLALFALISFYTALLHTLHRRRYGWKSRYGYVLLAVLSVFAMIERREAFHARPAPVHRPAMVESGQRPVLFVVGLDSATLDALLPLAGQGRLPFLATALQQGAYGRLESLQPAWREGVWITLATGKYPFKHGVTGGKVYDAGWVTPAGPLAELRLLPVGIRFRDWGTLGAEPRTPRAFPRQAAALWEILPRLGMSAGSVGWPASWLPSRETEFTLPEQFFYGKPRPAKLDAALRSQLGPNPPEYLVNALRADVWRESLALSLFDQHPGTGALFVVLPGLREVSRQTFGGFQAVQFEGEQSPVAREAAERLAAYYALLDSFLGELWLRVDGPRVLAVVSAYGTESREDPLRRERTAIEGSFGGAPDGVLLLYGEGIQPGALLTGARLVDVAPTLLYALGFPVALDLDGQVLRAAFDKRFLARHPLTILPSYEGLAKQ
ncbi:MAG TPA: alkaline phosphatase family protein [Thermoanaerobaculia bacterium]|nr:alkaline phosphatase family protein [Thermoanaerobaculia bacterium]